VRHTVRGTGRRQAAGQQQCSCSDATLMQWSAPTPDTAPCRVRHAPSCCTQPPLAQLAQDADLHVRELAFAARQYTGASGADPADYDSLYNHGLVLQELSGRLPAASAEQAAMLRQVRATPLCCRLHTLCEAAVGGSCQQCALHMAAPAAACDALTSCIPAVPHASLRLAAAMRWLWVSSPPRMLPSTTGVSPCQTLPAASRPQTHARQQQRCT
jgi:hypothetical protein